LKEIVMSMRIWLVVGTGALVVAGVTYAQFPIENMVANKVIQKYQNSTCEQLWAARGQQPGMEEQRVIGILKNDPQMRQAFFNQIAGPVMNKMFECGMIP
jgi:hypothetical protein